MEGARDGIDRSLLWEGTTIRGGGIEGGMEGGMEGVTAAGGIAAVEGSAGGMEGGMEGVTAAGGIAAVEGSAGGIAGGIAASAGEGGIAASANDSWRVVRINTAISTINRPRIDNLMTISTGSPCKI